MPYTLTIGRNGEQPFTIPGTCQAVSHEHARLLVDESGNWTLEDLKPPPYGNGTYVRDADGEFRLITKKRIGLDTVIRLGCAGHNGFTFYANRLVAPDNFSYEFDLLEAKLTDIRRRQLMIEAENEKKQKRIRGIRIGSGVLTLGILATTMITGSGLGIAPAMLTGAVTALLPGPDQKALKALLEEKKNILVCPSCFSPISEADALNRACPRCKAKG